MSAKSEIEFLMKLRTEAQTMVDNLTVRIVELQNPESTKKSIGFNKDKEDEKN